MDKNLSNCGCSAEIERKINMKNLNVTLKEKWVAYVPLDQLTIATGLCLTAIEEWMERHQYGYTLMWNYETHQYDKAVPLSFSPMQRPIA